MSHTERACVLSVAILVKDAAEPLAETLAAARPIADEILVLDTGSTDATLSVAREAQARILEHPWQDSFAEARNAGLRAAHGAWVLWLDAGETIPSAAALELKQFVQQQASVQQAYALLVQIPELGTAIAAEQVARVRLLPRRDELRYQGRVREQLKESLAACQIAVEGVPWKIERGAREHDGRRGAERARRNLRLAELQLREAGATADTCNAMGEALHTLGQSERATQCFRKALALSTRGSEEMLEAYYGLLTSLDDQPAQRDHQIAICLQALEIFPVDAQLLCAMGNYLHGTQHWELAARAFESAYRYGRIYPTVWHLRDIREIAASCWSLILQQQHKDEEAVRMLQEALQEMPHSLRLHRRLLDYYIQRGQQQPALTCITQMPRTMRHREALRNVVRGACLAQQGHWIAAKAYLQTAYQAGCREAVAFRWFVTALTACGEPERARAILLEWKELDPRNAEIETYLQALTTDRSASGKALRVDAPAATPLSTHAGIASLSSLSGPQRVLE